MKSEPPGWYRDPRRPGLARYWDGHAWVDVDQVVDGAPEPVQPDRRPLPTSPRLVAQRRSTDDSVPSKADAVDEVRPEQRDVSSSSSDPDSRKD